MTLPRVLNSGDDRLERRDLASHLLDRGRLSFRDHEPAAALAHEQRERIDGDPDGLLPRARAGKLVHCLRQLRGCRVALHLPERIVIRQGALWVGGVAVVAVLAAGCGGSKQDSFLDHTFLETSIATKVRGKLADHGPAAFGFKPGTELRRVLCVQGSGQQDHVFQCLLQYSGGQVENVEADVSPSGDSYVTKEV